MNIIKAKNGYKIILFLSKGKKLGGKKFEINIDFDFGINIPGTAEINSNQIEILLDGIVMANSLYKKEIIF